MALDQATQDQLVKQLRLTQQIIQNRLTQAKQSGVDTMELKWDLWFVVGLIEHAFDVERLHLAKAKM